MKQKTLYILAISSLILCMVLVGTYKKKQYVEEVPCPSQYATAEEATASFVAFTNDFYSSHPGANLSDLSNARYEFYIQNHCTLEIERYKQAEAGQADKETMDIINNTIQQKLKK